jgi:hypothetical protein
VRRALPGLAGLSVLTLVGPRIAAQAVSIGPQFALASYREVSSGLRYQGSGLGGALVARFRRLHAEASVVRLSFDPESGATATGSFKATEVSGWLAFDVATYASIEAGFIRRSVDPAFNAQSVGALRLGARSFYTLGSGATVLFHADYLAAPHFTGGGTAPFSIDLGLGLDVQLAGRVHATAAYAFQRLDRRTTLPGATQLDAAIEESLARLGLAVAF